MKMPRVDWQPVVESDVVVTLSGGAVVKGVLKAVPVTEKDAFAVLDADNVVHYFKDFVLMTDKDRDPG